MKRIVIILGLLAVCAAVSLYAAYHAGKAGDFVEAAVTRSFAAIGAGDAAVLEREIGALSLYWNSEEDRLAHFVHRAQLDEITRCITRLPALAAHEEYGELTAELASIRRQMERVRRNEQVRLSNLF